MSKRYALLAILALLVSSQYACAPLAAGVAGGAVGAAAQKHHDDKKNGD